MMKVDFRDDKKLSYIHLFIKLVAKINKYNRLMKINKKT